jgi:hypothetical protein
MSRLGALVPGGADPDPTPTPVTPGGLTPAGFYTDPIYVFGYAWVDIAVALTTPGGAAIASLLISPEWSVAPVPGATDWIPVYREEFAQAAAPTGNGTGLESPYTAQIPVAPADLPTTQGNTVRTRGLWMRFLVQGDATAANVNAAAFILRRTV